MTPDVPAFTSTGGAVLIVLAVCVFLFVVMLRQAKELDARHEDRRIVEDEQQAQQELYGLRSFPRRTELPRNRQRWS
jgi:hypothetical protein